jgi:hypothetical protein
MSQGTGRVRYILQHRYTTWTRTSTMITLGPSLTVLMGTQVMGSIIYTLVNRQNLFLPNPNLPTKTDWWGNNQVICHLGNDQVNNLIGRFDFTADEVRLMPAMPKGFRERAGSLNRTGRARRTRWWWHLLDMVTGASPAMTPCGSKLWPIHNSIL